MKKLPCLTKSKNRDGYYFTPTVDGKTKWIPLGNDKQVAPEKDHILMQGESRARSVNEALDLGTPCECWGFHLGCSRNFPIRVSQPFILIKNLINAFTHRGHNLL